MSHPQSTARIRFGEWQRTDHAQARLLWGNARVTRYISMSGYSQAAIANRLSLECTSQENDGVQYWPMFALDNSLIGVCGLQARGPKVYELGYHLLPAYWGAGYATEAAKAVIAFARTLGATALVARHHPHNAASKHILCTKLGFTYTHSEVYPPTGLVTPTYSLPLTHPQPTARLRFGNWHSGDGDRAHLLWDDPKVCALIAPDGIDADLRLQAECAAQAHAGAQYWPLFAQDGGFVGVCGLHARQPGVYELGYHLRPEYWGQRLAEEASRSVIAFARQVLQAQALIAGHHPHNLASKAVLQKLGFGYTHSLVYPPTGLRSPMYRLGL